MAGLPVAVPQPRVSIDSAKQAVRWFSRRVLLIFSIVVLALLVVTAVVAPLIDRHDPKIGDLDDKNTPPFWMGPLTVTKTVVPGIPQNEQTEISLQKASNLSTSEKILDVSGIPLPQSAIYLTREVEIVTGAVTDVSTQIDMARAMELANAGLLLQPFEDTPLTPADVEGLGQAEIKQIYAVVANPDLQIAQADAVKAAEAGTLSDLSGNPLTRAQVEGSDALGMEVQIGGAGAVSVREQRADDLVVQEVRRPAGIGTFPLGTDPQGRDLLSRIIWGARISLIVAAVTLIVGGTVGVALGLISGYFGGWVDEIIMRIVDIVLALPLVLVALVLVVAVGEFHIPFLPQKEVHLIASVLSLFIWVRFARQVRGEVLRLKTMDYVSLARISGCSTMRILVAHLLPGVLNTVIVVATLQVSVVILLESILSFLGAGVPPPTPAWGSMVSEGRNFLRTAWWVSTMPGLALLLTVLAFNLLGDWIRDALDPRLRNIG
jgi:peptide/nickel transport system permease protein